MRQRGDRRVHLRDAAFDASGQHAAEIIVVFEDRCEHRKRRLDIGFRRGEMRNDQLEQRLHRLAWRFEIGCRPAFFGRRIERREVELLVGRIERREQIEDFFLYLVSALVGPVRLVHDDDRFQSERQCLHGHKLGLRHRAFGGVDQHKRTVNHRQDAFDLAAEIRVAGGVDDIDSDIVPFDRRAFGEDGDPAFALLVV